MNLTMNKSQQKEIKNEKRKKQNRKSIWKYQFRKKNEIGLWLGEWVHEQGFSGRAVCKIHDDWEGLRRGTVDDWAHNLVEDMVDAGILEKFDDPETGEEMVKPV